LAERLKDGAVPASTIEQDAQVRGFGMRTLHRAKRELEIASNRNAGGWAWEIKIANEDAQSTLGNLAKDRDDSRMPVNSTS
jgi:hypothetical protein